MKHKILLALITIGSISSVFLYVVGREKSNQVDQTLLVFYYPLEEIANGETFLRTHGTLNMASLLQAEREAKDFHLHLKGVGVQLISPVITGIFKDSSITRQESYKLKETNYKEILKVTHTKLRKYVDAMKKLSGETILHTEQFYKDIDTMKGKVHFFYDKDSARLDFSHAEPLLRQLDAILKEEEKIIIYDHVYDDPTYVEFGLIHSYIQLKCEKLEQHLSGEIGSAHQKIFERMHDAFDLQFNNHK